MAIEKELDWDDIALDGKEERTDLEDGEYEFTVDHFERAKTGPESKNPGTNMAVVYCNIHAEGEPQLRVNLVLSERTRWKLKEFFISLGIIKAGAETPVKISWNDVPGRRGRCTIVHKPNYNDASKTHAEIDKFLPPAGGKNWAGGF